MTVSDFDSSKKKTTNKLSRRMRIRRDWQLYALLALPIAYIIIFKYVPLLGSQIAFRDYIFADGIWNSPWVGLENFQRFVDSPQFEKVMRNTISLSAYSLLVGFPIPILLALSLNQVKQHFFKKSVQLITYAPYFISLTVLIGMIIQFMNPRVGLIALIAKALGLEIPNILGDPDYFAHVYVWSGVWQTTGFGAIVYLSVLSAIDPTLHEAAVIDGANRLQRIWNIDIPGIIPTAVILLILSAGTLLQLGFEKAYLMQNPLNMGVSEVIDTYVYRIGLLGAVPDFSYATAIGLFKSTIGLILTLVVNYSAKRVTGESLW
jgi:multiple sugar transport system permease protein/putative aldouronate transport system permease protein